MEILDLLQTWTSKHKPLQNKDAYLLITKQQLKEITYIFYFLLKSNIDIKSFIEQQHWTEFFKKIYKNLANDIKIFDNENIISLLLYIVQKLEIDTSLNEDIFQSWLSNQHKIYCTSLENKKVLNRHILINGRIFFLSKEKNTIEFLTCLTETFDKTLQDETLQKMVAKEKFRVFIETFYDIIYILVEYCDPNHYNVCLNLLTKIIQHLWALYYTVSIPIHDIIETNCIFVFILIDFIKYSEKKQRQNDKPDNNTKNLPESTGMAIKVLFDVVNVIEKFLLDNCTNNCVTTNNQIDITTYIITNCALHHYNMLLYSLPSLKHSFAVFEKLADSHIATLLHNVHKNDSPFGISCCVPWNGTTRYHILENVSYVELLNKLYVMLDLLYSHGVNTVLIPAAASNVIDKRGEDYIQMVAKKTIPAFACDDAKQFFHTHDVRVICYGNYRKCFSEYNMPEAIQVFEQLEEETKDHKTNLLLYGLFSNDMMQASIDCVTEYLQIKLNNDGIVKTPPKKQEIIKAYYGVDISPLSLFIGMSKTQIINPPLLEKDFTDYYFTVAPHPYIDKKHIRLILYDHIFNRSSVYKNLLKHYDHDIQKKEENNNNVQTQQTLLNIQRMRKYYQNNMYQIIGLQKWQHNHGCPDIHIIDDDDGDNDDNNDNDNDKLKQ